MEKRAWSFFSPMEIKARSGNPYPCSVELVQNIICPSFLVEALHPVAASFFESLLFESGLFDLLS